MVYGSGKNAFFSILSIEPRPNCQRPAGRWIGAAASCIWPRTPKNARLVLGGVRSAGGDRVPHTAGGRRLAADVAMATISLWRARSLLALPLLHAALLGGEASAMRVPRSDTRISASDTAAETVAAPHVVFLLADVRKSLSH